MFNIFMVQEYDCQFKHRYMNPDFVSYSRAIGAGNMHFICSSTDNFRN